MTIEDLEKRVRYLEDMEEIKTLHREYLFHISNLDFDQALDCFAEGITVDVANYGRKSGKQDVVRFFKEVIYANVLDSRDGHFTCQPVVSIKGDRAKGHWMFYRLLAKPRGEGWVQGRYDCEYVRENGQWKFSFLKLTRPWPAFFGGTRNDVLEEDSGQEGI